MSALARALSSKAPKLYVCGSLVSLLALSQSGCEQRKRSVGQSASPGSNVSPTPIGGGAFNFSPSPSASVSPSAPASPRPSGSAVPPPANPPAVPAPTAANPFIGFWTNCYPIANQGFGAYSLVLGANNAFAMRGQNFADARCSQATSGDMVYGSGRYTLGAVLGNQGTEINLTYTFSSGQTRVDYLVIKVEGQSLRISNSCDANSLVDRSDAYCFGRRAPVGNSPQTRSLELDPMVFSRVQ